MSTYFVKPAALVKKGDLLLITATVMRDGTAISQTWERPVLAILTSSVALGTGQAQETEQERMAG